MVVSNWSSWSYRRQPAFTAARASNASTVILMLGTNDCKRPNWVNASHFVREYVSLIGAFRELPSTRRVIVLTPPPFLPRTGGNFLAGKLFRRACINGELPSLIAAAASQAAVELFNMHTAI